jgi:hypothetical protein
VALERKNPPVIPRKHQDQAEIAKGAKDGALSSSWAGQREKEKLNRRKEAEKRSGRSRKILKRIQDEREIQNGEE